MKKEIFTTYLKNVYRKEKGIFVLSFFLVFSTLGSLSAQCSLACDNLVQVSLDRDCSALITADMILEDSTAGCTYTVVVKDLNGLPIPDNTVRARHIGKFLQVGVFAGGNSCWGFILVEDKLPPVIECPEPDTVFCNQVNYILADPKVSDACSDVTKVVVSDVTTDYGCDSILAGKRTISYYYKDASGNHSDTCHQLICFQRIDPNIDIVWPRDTIFDCSVLDTVPYPNVSGVPTVGGESIYPSWGHVCHIGVTYEDQLIPVCPKTFKVLRKWTFVDWCRPGNINQTIHYQIIKILDNRGPVLSCTPNVTVSTDIWTCTGTVVLPPPTIIEECSKVTVAVGYKIASQNGTPTFDGTSTSNVTKLSNGLYSVTGLPLGLSWVIFHVTDECGNFTDCATEVLVEDKVPPIAVCDQKTVVTLTIDGTAKIAAITFDDGSLDNCGILNFEARRMDNGFPCNTLNGDQFGPYVFFCCDDIGKTLMVAMRVWDVHGNSNTCMVEVTVQDKLPPVIVCPPDITVSCEFDFTDLNVFGTVRTNVADRKPIVINDIHAVFNGPAIDGYAYDGCGVVIKETVTYDLKCNNGRIYRRFDATDPGGLTSTCTQTIRINDFNPNNVSVVWPNDYVNTTTCLSKPQLTPDITGKPQIVGADKCSNIIQTYDDVVFTLDPDACLKILRKWIVIDWCVYNPNDPHTYGYWTWTQVIKVMNFVPPVFQSSCLDRTVDVFGPGCTGFVNLVASATDDCTDTTNLVWYHEIDIDNNGTIDQGYSGPGKDASGVYPIGVHKVTFRVKDACNNEAICRFLLTVRDGKKPTPVCIGQIVTTVMPSTQSITIWAKDFNLKSEDNCTPRDSLKYYFLVNGHFDPSMLFDCSSIGKNLLRIYVIDQAGNSDYCEATLEIQDPNHVCPTGITVGGKIASLNNKGIKDAIVSWERTTPAGSNSLYTDQNGNFSFLNLTSGMNYAIKVEKNIEFTKGVTTLDIVLIQRHILGIQTFDSPFKYLAADVNNNCNVTAADISEIRRLILGKINAFAVSPSWKFVPVNSVLPSNTPCGFQHVINYNLINRNQLNADFYGIKMGDINFDVDAGGLHSTTGRSGKQMELYSMEENIIPGVETRIPVYISEAMEFEGMQFAMSFNPEFMKSIKIESAQLHIDEDQYSITADKILVSVADASKNQLDPSKPLFTLVVNAVKPSTVSHLIQLDENALRAESYDNELNIHPLSFNVRNSNAKAGELSSVLYQNKPNPFDESTIIGFEIPKNQEVEFVFYEMNGKVIHKFTKKYDKGYHEFELKKSELNTFGVFFMQMNTSDFTDTKRLVLIR